MGASLSTDPDMMSLYHNTLISDVAERLVTGTSSGLRPSPKSLLQPVTGCHDVTIQLPQLVDWTNPMYSEAVANDSGTR